MYPREKVSLYVYVRLRKLNPLASLGWVLPGAATEGFTRIFSCKKLFFASHFFIDFTRVSPPLEGVTPHFFTCPISFVYFSL